MTNNTLDELAGTELYLRDIALGLRRRGHTPVAYSTLLGAAAKQLRHATIPVIDDLDRLGVTPDVIHGQHNLETMTAALHFPSVPVVSFCHGWLPWQEAPSAFPTVARWVAVDRTCLDRLRLEHGIAESQIKLIYNFVDLERFRVGPPLPERPKRALVFSNAASESTHLPAVRAACFARGIAVDVGGTATYVIERPEELLGSYDVVFAKARAAMEAMATGRAVVLCDYVGSGPLVCSKDFEALRELNFGIRALQRPLTAEAIGQELDRYDPRDAERVRDAVREHCDLERRLDEIESLYHEVVTEGVAAPSPTQVGRAAAAYLRRIAPRIKWADARYRNVMLESADHARQASELAEKEQQAARLVAQLIAINESLARQVSELQAAQSATVNRE